VVIVQVQVKSVVKTWSDLYVNFVRLSALVANAEPNIACEQLMSGVRSCIDQLTTEVRLCRCCRFCTFSQLSDFFTDGTFSQLSDYGRTILASVGHNYSHSLPAASQVQLVQKLDGHK